MPPAAATAAARRSSVRRAAATAPGPRRISGPARPAKQTRKRRAAAGPQPLAFRLVGALHGLTEGRLVDRLVRGQIWIAIVGVGLIGIVFMQVSMLRMNAGIGTAVERTAVLERENAALEASISKLSSSERIQKAAARAGMIQASDATGNFLDASNVSMRKAVNGITAPSANPPPATMSSVSSLAATAAAATKAAEAAAGTQPTNVTADGTTPATGVAQATGATTTTGASPTTGATTPTATTTPTGTTTATGAATSQTSAGAQTQTPVPQPNPAATVAGGAAATGP